MGHHHNHSHHNASKNISAAFFLNFLFAIIELVGGLLTNSVAILSDALHDFGDSISLGIAWVLERKSQKERDKKYTYGYKRFSLLGSVFLSGMLAVSSIFVLFEAVKRLFDPQPVHAEGMFWLAILGILINGLAAFRLKKGYSLNERAVFLHIIEDVLGWVAVLVTSIVMLFTNLPILDPILSVLITIWVLFNVVKNLKSTVSIFLQAVPNSFDIEELTRKILSIKEIESIHDLHIWTQDGESHVMTLHVVTTCSDLIELKEQIKAKAKFFGIDHTTVEIERSNETCNYC